MGQEEFKYRGLKVEEWKYILTLLTFRKFHVQEVLPLKHDAEQDLDFYSTAL